MDAPAKRLKLNAPQAYVPPQIEDPYQTINDFFRIQQEIKALVRAAAHDRRHLWQARQALQSMDRNNLSASST